MAQVTLAVSVYGINLFVSYSSFVQVSVNLNKPIAATPEELRNLAYTEASAMVRRLALFVQLLLTCRWMMGGVGCSAADLAALIRRLTLKMKLYVPSPRSVLGPL